MRTLRLADLNVRLVGGVDRQGAGTGPLVVLLHGYGAPGEDLVPLQRVLDVPREVRFAFPEAPLSPPELAMFGGRAWWEIDVMALQRAAAQGRARERMAETPPGLPGARRQVDAMLTELVRELSVPEDQLILGGFSQGAMLALDVALHTDRPLAGLILLSTTYLNASVWQPLMAARVHVPVLQTHGVQDPLLSFDIATELRDALRAAGSKVEWVEFRGGHELPQSVLDAVSRFIRTSLTSASER
jgi:phospholipase/carboxylesterase